MTVKAVVIFGIILQSFAPIDCHRVAHTADRRRLYTVFLHANLFITATALPSLHADVVVIVMVMMMMMTVIAWQFLCAWAVVFALRTLVAVARWWTFMAFMAWCVRKHQAESLGTMPSTTQ